MRPTLTQHRDALALHGDRLKRYLRGDFPNDSWRPVRLSYGLYYQLDHTSHMQRIKLPAGDMILYPGTTVHRVEPVTRGARIASFFWVQSMVREDAKREILFELDTSLQQLGRDTPGHESVVRLAGVIGSRP